MVNGVEVKELKDNDDLEVDDRGLDEERNEGGDCGEKVYEKAQRFEIAEDY